MLCMHKRDYFKQQTYFTVKKMLINTIEVQSLVCQPPLLAWGSVRLVPIKMALISGLVAFRFARASEIKPETRMTETG